MTVSNLVGTLVTPDEPIIQYMKRDEHFYLVYLAFGATKIPMVVSEHLLEGIQGKVAVQGYLTSTYVHNADGKRHLFTFFQATDLVPVSDTTEDYNIVNVDIVVTQRSNYKVSTSTGRAHLSLVGKSIIYGNHSSVIHTLGFERYARQLKNCQAGDRVVGKGRFHRAGEPIEIVFTEIESIIRKEDIESVG